MSLNEFHHLWVHDVTPAATTEDTVMACARHFQVLAFAGRYASAEVLCSAGLARARDVIQLALDSHQARAFDVLRANALHFAVHTLDVPSALDQLEVLEHGLDGFQIVIGIHVEHGVVLVVKLTVRFGAGVVTLDQVLEVVVMAGGMAVGVHGHKASVLQKPGVHTATGTCEIGRYAVDHIVFKPIKALVGRQVVHRCG